jgi:hypothetical protein
MIDDDLSKAFSNEHIQDQSEVGNEIKNANDESNDGKS